MSLSERVSACKSVCVCFRNTEAFPVYLKVENDTQQQMLGPSSRGLTVSPSQRCSRICPGVLADQWRWHHSRSESRRRSECQGIMAGTALVL